MNKILFAEKNEGKNIVQSIHGYHGGASYFDAIDPGIIGTQTSHKASPIKAFYLTTDKDYARAYAIDRASQIRLDNEHAKYDQLKSELRENEKKLAKDLSEKKITFLEYSSLKKDIQNKIKEIDRDWELNVPKIGDIEEGVVVGATVTGIFQHIDANGKSFLDKELKDKIEQAYKSGVDAAVIENIMDMPGMGVFIKKIIDQRPTTTIAVFNFNALKFDNQAVANEIALPDTHTTFERLQPILNKQGYELNRSQQPQHMKNGGKLSGETGGYLEGPSHAEGGIPAINKGNNDEKIEMEGGEVVINKRSVADETIQDFNGEKLTNRQVLSKINQSGGGVAFADGGEIPEQILVSGAKHKYNGEEITDIDFVSSCGCKHKMRDGGEITIVDETEPFDYDIIVEESETFEPTEEQRRILHKLRLNPDGYLTVAQAIFGSNDALVEMQKKGIVYHTHGEDNTLEIRLTDYGKEIVEALSFEYGTLKLDDFEGSGRQARTKKLRKGGEVKGDYFKGIDHQYKNPFELNKAIEELVDIIGNGVATPEQKVFLGYYTGYGGLEKYGAEGKGLLYEYFTPAPIAKKMWGLAYKYGFKGGRVLEPACGVGEFIKYAPDQSKVSGFEINLYSYKICKLLYPNASISSEPFESLFIVNRKSIKNKIDGLPKYDLIIGNPPYGQFAGMMAGMGERAYTQANNFIEYFIFRGLDLLNKGGLLVFIVGSEVAAGGTAFLDRPHDKVRDEIAQKSIILDGYRLPNGVFDRTDVLTDIIVLQKK